MKDIAISITMMEALSPRLGFRLRLHSNSLSTGVGDMILLASFL